MLTLGIPSFRLEKDVINAEIDVLRELGVTFKTGVEVGKDVTILPCNSNIPLGVMDNWEYTMQEITIEKDTLIFLYTDGLNEAESVNHELFGKKNIRETFIKYLQLEEKSPRSLIDNTKTAVKEFVGEAEQSDDMTMLAIQYKCG